jgi:soluble cytochrome b562
MPPWEPLYFIQLQKTKMAANALKKINARAKEIMRKHPGKKYSTAQKEAGREYRNGKISGTRGNKKKSKAAPRKKSSRGKRIGSVAGPTVGQQEAALKRNLKEQLGWMLVTIEQAKTKTEKNKLRKRAVEIRRKLRALS